MTKKPIRLSDVARLAGVSVATASKALNGSGRMTDETRLRVKDAAAKLDFRPNATARALASNRSLTIGLLTNDTYGRFTLPVMTGVAAALMDEGVSVFLCSIEDDPVFGKTQVDAMLDKRVDGIISTGKRIDRQLPVDLSNLSIPVVYAFSGAPKGSVVLVPDDAQGSRDAASWLVGLGRKKLMHITGPESFAAVKERASAFREIAGPDARVLYGSWTEAWGREAIAELWAEGGAPPDGIFCGNDQIARGVLDTLLEHGVKVPDEVSVIGFDNWEVMASATRPPLTTVDMNLKALGQEAGRLILDMSDGKAVEPGIRKLPCSLVVRDSCGGTPPKEAPRVGSTSRGTKGTAAGGDGFATAG